jgi:hypothetical protein
MDPQPVFRAVMAKLCYPQDLECMTLMPTTVLNFNFHLCPRNSDLSQKHVTDGDYDVNDFRKSQMVELLGFNNGISNSERFVG